MTVIIDGTTGVDKVVDGSIAQVDLASGVAGTGPAFSAKNSAATSITISTYTKVILNIETIDTKNCFDPTTNYRFTPNVAGYYSISAVITYNAGTSIVGTVRAVIYKNGSHYKEAWGYYNGTEGLGGASVSDIIYLNGSTDYIEFYTYQSVGAIALQNGGCFMSGFLAAAV